MAKQDIDVQELVQMVERKTLILPEMQRRYVWTATRVRDLLDSLYRGYPSGTILVWDSVAEEHAREMQIETDGKPLNAARFLLLDGQQRITSLTAVIKDEPVIVRGRKKPISIYFNLEHPDGPPIEVQEVDEDEYTVDVDADEPFDILEELSKRTFVVESLILKNNPLWVRVSDIFKMSDKELLKPLGINSDDDRWDKYSHRLSKVRGIRDYQYSMQVLESSMSYAEVTEIFVRVNSLGVKLRSSDLALAVITSKWHGFMAMYEDFAKDFGDDGDYLLNTNLPIKLMVSIATKQSRFETIGKIPLAKIQQNWELAKESLNYAVNFIRTNAGIESLDFLSSPFLLIPIAVYYNIKSGTISDEETKKLLRWFFLAHMRGHFGMGASESHLDADLSVLFKEGSLDSLIKKLFDHVKKFELDSNDLVGKNTISPIFSTLYFVLRKNQIKDWFTGLPISGKHLGRINKIEFHHIFPKSLLSQRGVERSAINEIANLTFIGGKTNRSILNKEPKDYFKNVVIPKNGEESLQSHLIPTDENYWEMEKYNDFLIWRREAIAKEINAFLAKLV